MATYPLPSGSGNEPVTPPQSGVIGLLPDTVRWLGGWLGTWFVLSALADTSTLGELAAALAASVAIAATFILGPSALKELGY